MALMSYPNVPAIAYKGFGGYLEKEKCEEARVIAENNIADYEEKRGNIVFIETFCMDMEAFVSSLKDKSKIKATELGA